MPSIEFQPLRFEGVHCHILIDMPAQHVILLRISGSDVGEFGNAPMLALQNVLASADPVDLFIDAGEVRAASLQVSGEWAHWLAGQKDRLRSVTMLTGSRFIQMTAEFVRRFAELQGIMTLMTDAKQFHSNLDRTRRPPG